MAWKLKDLFTRSTGSTAPASPPAPAAATAPASLAGTGTSTDAHSWLQRGNGHVSQQRWQAALDCYREASRLDPRLAEAHAYAGNVFRQLRDPGAALAAYDRALAVKPGYAEVHYNRGSLLHQARQPEAALDSYDAALASNPAITEAHCSRGDVLRELGRSEDAMASYNMAITVNGSNAKAFLHRGILQQKLRLTEAAEASYRQAIALKAGYADAHFNLGVLQSDARKYAQALTSFDAAIAAGPGLARAFSNRAQAQAKLGLLTEARASHEQAVLLDPQDAPLHFNRGVFLSDQKDWQGAIGSYREATALRSEYADAYCNLGLAQQELGLADEALVSYARALAINPTLAKVFNNRGNLFRSRKQFAESMLDYHQAIALEPNSAEGHFNIAQLALLQGDFATGWPEYEWRRLIEEALTVSARELPQPEWTGQPLQGKHIFLHAEQGLGDTLQFCRFASVVARLGANVTLEVQKALVELLANLDGVARIMPYGLPVPTADYQCSLVSLPLVFKTTLETIPCEVPYLRADPLKVARCLEIIGARARPRVGLAWSGNPRNSNARTRDVALARIVPHLADGIDYFCLQHEMSDEDGQALRSHGGIAIVESQLKTLADTAALMATLDLVISVDTGLAHLSAALGKKTWIFLAYLTDWRWLLERTDSPWYPSATLYRQPEPYDWDSVLARVGKDLLQIRASS